MITKKKILIIGSKQNYTLDKMYFRALKELKHKVEFYHTHDTVRSKFILFFEKYLSFFYYFLIRFLLLNYLKKKNNFDLIIFFKGLYLNKKFLIKVKKFNKKTKLVNIFPDNPLNIYDKNISNPSLLETIDLFDYFCLWSKSIIKKLRNKKNLLYLPFGYDKYTHIKVKKDKKYSNEINFIGSYDIKRAGMLKSIKKKILIAGNGWKGIENLGRPIFENELSKVISSSSISINILRDQNKDSHNMRTFEIPAMGGLMLTSRSIEQNLFFKENKECLMYNGKKELNQKIKYIMNNKNKIGQIKKKAFIKSKKHSYTNRSVFLLSKVFK